MTRFISLCLYLFLFTSLVQGQNWTSFRGQNASGVSDGHKTATVWNAEKSTNVLWKTQIPGLSHASPIIWGEKIFVVTAISDESNITFQAKDRGIGLAADNAKHAWKIYSLDKQSGKILWEQTAHVGVPRSKRHVKATQANATPVTDGRYVVALMGSEGLYCYEVNGKLIWKQDLGVLNPGLYGDPTSEWGHSSSPIIYKDLVIVLADCHKQSFIAAYNLKDGKQAWRVERGEITSWSTPTIYEGKARVELIVNGGHFIRGYDPATGKELWRFSDSDTQVKQQAPIIAQDLIILAGGYPLGRPMYAFRPGASGDISLKDGQEKNDFLVWRAAKGSPYTPTPIAYGEHLYVCADNGIFSAYNLKTGELIYQQRLPSSFSASPVAADGKLYMPSEDGEVFVVKAGPKFELLATNPMGESLMATPAISEGVIYVRSQKFLYSIGERK
jgi:outer membrane protein assembly factor BamB